MVKVFAERVSKVADCGGRRRSKNRNLRIASLLPG